MAFIGLEPPKEISKVLSELVVPGNKVNALEYHITLIHFDLDKEDISKLIQYIEPLFNLCNKTKPLGIQLKTLDYFQSDKDNAPIILLVDSPELVKFQKSLAKELEKLDLNFSKNFKTFIPHVSLSFCDKKENKKFLKNLPLKLNPKLTWQAQNIILWGGSQNDQTAKFEFPLSFEINDLDKLTASKTYSQLISLASKI